MRVAAVLSVNAGALESEMLTDATRLNSYPFQRSCPAQPFRRKTVHRVSTAHQGAGNLGNLCFEVPPEVPRRKFLIFIAFGNLGYSATNWMRAGRQSR